MTLKNLPKSFHNNQRLLTSMINGLMACGDIAMAESIFNSTDNQSIEMRGSLMKGKISLSIYISFMI